MRIAIVINEQRQNDSQLDKKVLDALAAKYDLSYDLFIVEADDLQPTIQSLLSQSYNGLLIGGGDGTVRSAAQLLLDQEIPLAIFPLGTFNAFASHLEHTADMDALFKIIKNNKIKLVDVGEVNGYVFLNHSSIGFYSHIMKLRKKHSGWLGKSKILKILFSMVNFFNVVPVYNLTLKVDDKELSQKICLVVVGNNYHSTEVMSFVSTVPPTMGMLEVLVLTCQTKWELFKAMLGMLFFSIEKNKYLTRYNTDNLSISGDSKLIDAVVDGDLFKLELPLHYTVNHKKLTVFSL